MNICMITSVPIPPECGIGHYVTYLSKKLVENGHTATIITRGRHRFHTFEMEGIRVIKVPYLPCYPLHMTVHGIFLNRIIGTYEKDFDVIHVHMPLVPLIKTACPIVATMHGSLKGNARGVNIVDLRSFGIRILLDIVSIPLCYRYLQNAEVVTTVSPSVEKEIRQYYGFQEALVAGNGVDEKKFCVKSLRSKDYILFVGRLSYEKGIFDLIESFPAVCDEYDISLVIAGSGVLRDKLWDTIVEKNMQGRIHLLGAVTHEELVHLYQDAALFVLPSYYEGLPTVILEAMACGLPVVTTSVTGCIDLVRHGSTGLIVPPRAPDLLADAIKKLLKKEEYATELGKNGRLVVETDYTWDGIALKYLQCYRMAIEEKNTSADQ